MELRSGFNNFLPSLDSLGINTTFINTTSTNSSQKVYASTLSNQDFTAISSSLTRGSLNSPYQLFNSEKPTPKPQTIKTSTNDTPSSFSEIRKGEVLSKGDKSNAVKELQKKLNSLGFKVNSTGYYGEITEQRVKQFQKKYGIQQTGNFGPTTLKKLDELTSSQEITQTSSSVKIGLGKATPMGTKLATAAKKEATRRGTVGWCYAGVATAVTKVFGGFLYGESAYMAANILARNSKFKEVKVTASDLKKLAPGSIVVWGKTKASPHGHISIALGNGKEASDHVNTQLTSLRGYQNFRVFTPKV